MNKNNQNEIIEIERLLSAQRLPADIQIHTLVGENEQEIIVSEMNQENSIVFYKVSLNYEERSQNPQLAFEIIPDIFEHLEAMNLSVNSEKEKKGDSTNARKK